ncbi:pglyrp1 isoform X3 [Brachionus plicatilis]|uniref:Pglyrp1 isoform X3 n=1 Tax=Brachionus plicatilis TaxID=10195 RepID=A0A3M7P6V2_BRAPC|nr:pglyrp1 isoform X3 [Brachionus plicatilis]
MLKILIFLYFISAINTSTFFGHKKYTEFEIGNLNILISVPHGGNLFPDQIPDRTEDGLGNFKGDYNTRPFGEELSTQLHGLFGQKPFMVYNNLHRRKMDPNRNSSVCCSSQTPNLECHAAHFEYHKFISDYAKNMSQVYKYLLIFDIHGQSHKENWTEIGYLLGRNELNKVLVEETSKSSVNSLKESGAFSMEEIIRGNVSFGAFMEREHFRVVPSPSIKRPDQGGYYSGGYITAAHKSQKVNTIQIELTYGLRKSIAVAKLNAAKLAKSIHDFYKFHRFYLNFY